MEKRLKIEGITEALKYSELFSNEYHKERIMQDIKFCQHVRQFYPCYIVCHVYEYISEGKTKYSYEYSQIILIHSDIEIEIKLWHKKYSIFGYFAKKYPEIKIVSDEPEPQKIGVLSTKKIETWIKYIEKIDKLYQEKSEKANDKINNFLTKLNEFNIEWDNYSGKSSGYIDKNGLRYSFRIDKNGYIYETIQIKDSLNLETFLKLTK
jgi:hypothetical protein